MITKTVSRRDSATTILRKLGVKPRDYDLFVKKSEINGTVDFTVEIGKAKDYLASLTQTLAPTDADEAPPKKVSKDASKDEPNPFNGLGARAADPAEPAKKPAKKSKAPKTEKATPKVEKPVPSKKEPRVTMSSIARAMILEGKTNAEVWAVVQAKFNLPEKARYYPGWWRFELRRKGHAV